MRQAQIYRKNILAGLLTEEARIKVVPHSLVRLADGTLGYITRRIDRTTKGEKLDMEDMCQLTLHPTEYKYKSSYEQIGKTIAAYSSTPKLDLVRSEAHV